jgi:putative inorganic carbon (HCO3(-)) transporter
MKEKIITILNFLFEYSLLALIFLLPSIFSLQALTYNVFELPKAEIFHLLVFLSFISLAGVFLIKKEVIWRFSWKIPALISVFIVFYFFSCFFSTNQGLSFFGSYSRRQGFFQIIFYAVFFILLLFSLNKEKMAKKIVFTAVFSSIIPVVYGLVQLLGYDFFRWAEDFGRVFSTFGQPNFFGHYLILIIPLTIYAAVFLTKRSLPKIF